MAGSKIKASDLRELLVLYQNCVASFEIAATAINKKIELLETAGDRDGLSGGEQGQMILDTIANISSNFANLAGKVTRVKVFIDKKLADADAMSKNTGAISVTAAAVAKTKKEANSLIAR